jgi:tripartite-type tricarboxylate transporter receptor subunit TctC
MPVCRSIVGLLAFLLLGSGSAFADAWPSRPVRAIVPFPPGATGDSNARPFADELGKLLGQTFVVENRGGGNATIGTEAVARAAPDGYTVLFTPMSPMIMQPHLSRKLAYDPFENFVPVSMMTRSLSVLGAHPSLGAKSLKDAFEIARAKPDTVFFGTAAIGGITHLRVLYLNQLAGVKMTAVPYAGSGPALVDLLAGHIHMLFDSAVAPSVKSGKLVGLGILDSERDPDLPDVPTMDEAAKAAGLAGFAMPTWQAAWYPKGTPPEIVEKLSAAMRQVATNPDLQRRLRLGSLSVWTSTPAEMDQIVRRDYAFYGKMIQDAGIQPE